MMILLLPLILTYSFFFLLVFEAINVSATRQATGNVFNCSPILSKIVFGDEEMEEIVLLQIPKGRIKNR